jgi:hypothetical protein
MLFFFSPSHPKLQRRIEVISAAASAVSFESSSLETG